LSNTYIVDRLERATISLVSMQYVMKVLTCIIRSSMLCIEQPNAWLCASSLWGEVWGEAVPA